MKKVAGEDMWHVRKSGKMSPGFRWGNLGERDHSVEPGVDGNIILRWSLLPLH